MNSISSVVVACATLATGLSLGTTDAFAAKPGSGLDNCTGKQPSFVFNKTLPGSVGRYFYLADATGLCQRFLFSVNAGDYDRYASFRVVGSEGRVVTTDGLERMILATFTIETDMSVGPVDVRPLFDQANPGAIDNGSFELAEDGRALVYVTFNEDGQDTWLSRLRVLADVDSCFGCSYDQGTVLAERVGLNYTLESPRFGADGSTIWLKDRRGDFYRPYLSTVPAIPPETGLHEPQIAVDGGLLGRELHILGLRSRGDTELLAYTAKTGSGCPEIVVVDTATCSDGACGQVNSTTPAVLTSARAGSFAGTSEAGLELLLEDANVGKKGQCSATRAIKRTIDTGSAVQSTVIANGVFPSSK